MRTYCLAELGVLRTMLSANDKDNKPEQVALMTKKASRKIWVMRRVKMKMKNVGLDGKNYLRFFFWRLRGMYTLRQHQLFGGAVCLSRHGHIFTKLDNPHVKVGNVEKECKDPVCRTRIWAIGYGLFGPFMICICVNSLNSTYLILIHTKSY